jgi:hypothetical protein
MKQLYALVLAALPLPALACDTAVCLVSPESLILPRIIDFDDLASGWGPGVEVTDVLPLQGASFGQHFAGQLVGSSNTFDQISGPAFTPLTLMAGPKGENLSVVNFSGNSVINGWGAAGFPKRDAQGEGAIAVLFDNDQSALAFDLRGGEAGAAMVTFLRRNGDVIASVPVAPTGEFAVAFIRQKGKEDIAGFVLTNTDPQGLAIDTLRFGKPPEVS